MIASLALLSASIIQTNVVSVADPNITYSPYNWYRSGSEYAQTPNPGAYLKMGFTGTSLSVGIDVSSFTSANIPAAQYPVVRYSVDGGPATTLQLTATTKTLECAKGLKAGNHSLLLQYVAGYVFLDFWTPINVLKVTGFTLDDSAMSAPPSGPNEPQKRYALFLGDSITNGDDDIATFAGGITNAVDTQDATIGYPSVVAAATKAEYGVVAYGGASWDSTAADGHTPGLMTFWSMFDKEHSRLVPSTGGYLPGPKFSPIPDDIYINMGENRPPHGDDVPKLLEALRVASNPNTHIFVIIPFSGRAREPLMDGLGQYREDATRDKNVFVIDLGDNPYLPVGRATMFSVDGQHPLAALHAQLGAQIVAERARLLDGK